MCHSILISLLFDFYNVGNIQMSVSHQRLDQNLTKKLLFFQNSWTVFIGDVIRFINKINRYIHEAAKPQKVVCISNQLTVILRKLMGVNDQFICLTENADNMKRPYEIFFEQNIRILNVKTKQNSYFAETSRIHFS